MSVRERLIEILMRAGRPMTASEIARELGLPPGAESQVYEHVVHASRSLRARTGGTLSVAMEPARCRKCGYEFRSMKRPRKPRRCPRCGSEWIEPPKFAVIGT